MEQLEINGIVWHLYMRSKVETHISCVWRSDHESEIQVCLYWIFCKLTNVRDILLLKGIFKNKLSIDWNKLMVVTVLLYM